MASRTTFSILASVLRQHTFHHGRRKILQFVLLLFEHHQQLIGLSLARGKTQELGDELRQANDKRDKGFLRKKTALKKIVANMTMGNDSALFLTSSVTPRG